MCTYISGTPVVPCAQGAGNPGPDVYKLPSTLSRNAVGLAKRIDAAADSDSPGPAVYRTVPLNKYKRDAPRYTLAKWFAPQDAVRRRRAADATPSPQTYNPAAAQYKYGRAPAFSFGARRSDKFPPLVVCGDQQTRGAADRKPAGGIR